MARTPPRPPPTRTQTLQPSVRHGPCGGDPRGAASHHYRTRTTLEALRRLTLQRRRCRNPACPHVRQPYRPAVAGRRALPQHACGLDGLTCMGPQRSAHHARVPTLPQALGERGMAVAPRTVTHRLERSDDLGALSRQDTARRRRLTPPQGRVLRARDGLQPDGGQAVLWGLRDCLAGEGRLARSFLSAPPPTWPRFSARSRRLGQCPWRGACPMGRGPSAPLSPRPSLRGPPTGVTCPPCPKRPSPSLRPTVMPRRSSKNRAVGGAPWHVPWRDAPLPRLRASGATGVPSGVPAPMMADRLWRLPVSSAPIASRPVPRAWSGGKKGGLAPGARAPADAPAPWAGRDGVPVARGACGLWLGPSRRAHPAS
jgi:hypothetical protein